MRPPIVFSSPDSELLVVPAIHFNNVFAREVNRICSDPKMRPEAIAVELGPETAETVKIWLQELAAGRQKGMTMPVMLGLLQPNRMIRSSLREKAMRLQRDMGMDLSELPAAVLNDELGFSGHSLLCISPTDSIIEAIRCAVELRIPLYGVDLEDTADGKYKPIVIRDPIAAREDLVTYTAEGVSYAERERDEETDYRREVAMAARLKTLLTRHKRIVFTCGMAHWLPVQRLLEDPSVRPGVVPENVHVARTSFRRILVHPQIAVQYMDRFPCITAEYENSRSAANESRTKDSMRRLTDPATIFESLMTRAYKEYFVGPYMEDAHRHRHRDLFFLSRFEDYLRDLCIFRKFQVPDIFLTMKSAQQLMSVEFVRQLSKTLMEFPWAAPSDYPEYPLLGPGPEDAGQPGQGIVLHEGLYGEYPFIKIGPSGDTLRWLTKIPWEWDKEKEARQSPSEYGALHTWGPWNYLVTSMSLQAISRSSKKQVERRVEAFKGSLMDGVDIRETVRGYSRGEKGLYVKSTLRSPVRHGPFNLDGFPVVWVLQPEECDSGEWHVLYEEWSWMKKHIPNGRQFKRKTKQKGNKMVAIIGYSNSSQEIKHSEADSHIRCDRYHGFLLYQPICWSHKQFAAWLRETRGTRNPFCDLNHLGEDLSGDLAALFSEQHGIRIGEYDWMTTLLLLAIPFAKEIVTAVLPDDYRIHPVVAEKAQRYRVELCRSPLDSFSERRLERVSKIHLVPSIAHEPDFVCPHWVEKAIGESPTMNRSLVPDSCLAFGETTKQ